ncbi:MAG: ribosome silencing factor [Candidatus Coatesbacteria bacterium]|nr:MAG: ribosome silencing factor [Candidatus Coatesbacteria bacterium]
MGVVEQESKDENSGVKSEVAAVGGSGRGSSADDETQKLLALIRGCIEERKGRDIVVLDLTELTPVTDYFVICSGTSSMHTRAISEHIEVSCKKAGFRYFGIEGEQNAKWVLMDYGDIVVHIFVDETRWFYNLERLWGDARRVDLESD